MPSTAEQRLSLGRTLRQWWNEGLGHEGCLRTLRCFMAALWEFARESTPARRRRRYGDVEYDWDFRVDTTSATVGWRDRWLGVFLSPYQATEPALFREMMEGLRIEFREFTFIDLGSGKGRVLLMAAEFPFRRIVGVELLPGLHRVAQENLSKYRSDSQKCFAVESFCGDAREFVFPPEPTVLYLFNPLPEAGLVEVVARLERSLRECPRPVYVLYHNPLLESVFSSSTIIRKIGGTQRYSIYASGGVRLERLP
jgi:SAM-dependent methyltransferase